MFHSLRSGHSTCSKFTLLIIVCLFCLTTVVSIFFISKSNYQFFEKEFRFENSFPTINITHINSFINYTNDKLQSILSGFNTNINNNNNDNTNDNDNNNNVNDNIPQENPNSIETTIPTTMSTSTIRIIKQTQVLRNTDDDDDPKSIYHVNTNANDINDKKYNKPQWEKSKIGIGIERSPYIYNRRKECLAKIINRPSEFPKMKDPRIVWEWQKSNNIQPKYSIIYTVFDRLNRFDDILLMSLKLARGQYELVIVFDDVTNDTVTTISELMSKWIPIIHNNNRNHHLCSLEDITSNKNSKLFQYNDKRIYLDQKYNILLNYCSNISNSTKKNEWGKECGDLQRVIFVRVDNIFETSSNNIGMCITYDTSEIYIHLQDDMMMTQVGWNIITSLPILLFPSDVWSTSTRMVHGIQQVASKFQLMLGIHPKRDEIIRKTGFKEDMYDARRVIGRGGADIDIPLNMHSLQEYYTVFVRDMGNRGPLVFNASDVWKLGLFDEYNYHLLYDDGEIHLRALNSLHPPKFCGFIPMQFRADLAWGASRRTSRVRSSEEMKIKEEFTHWRKSRESNKATFRDKQIFDIHQSRPITRELLNIANNKHHICLNHWD